MVSVQAILLGVASTLASVCALDPNLRDWRSLGTEGGQVMYDGKTLCRGGGEYGGGGLLCATENIDSYNPFWRYVPGDLKWAAIWGDYIWATTRMNELMVGTNSYEPNWRVVPGSFKQVTTDGKQVCAVSGNNNLFCADDAIMTNPNWRQLPGSFKQAELTDGILYAVGVDNTLSWGYSDGDPNWIKVAGPPGGAEQVAYDGAMLCAISNSYQLFCADEYLRQFPNWMHLPGEYINVDVEAGRVFAVGRDTMIREKWFTAPPPKMDGWIQLKTLPNLRQLHFDGRTLCGTTSDSNLWCATDGFDAGTPNWQQLPGTLSQVVVWGDALYGVNGVGNVWTANSRGPPQWRLLNGNFKQISTDGKQLCGVDNLNNVWCADSQLDSNPQWVGPKGTFTNILVLDGALFGTSPVDDFVWVGRSYGEPRWIQLQGRLRNLDYDGVNLCGTDASNTIICANSGFLSSPNWKEFPGKGLHTTVNSGNIFVVNSKYEVYWRNDVSLFF